jgi:hypothetical protein
MFTGRRYVPSMIARCSFGDSSIDHLPTRVLGSCWHARRIHVRKQPTVTDSVYWSKVRPAGGMTVAKVYVSTRPRLQDSCGLGIVLLDEKPEALDEICRRVRLYCENSFAGRWSAVAAFGVAAKGKCNHSTDVVLDDGSDVGRLHLHLVGTTVTACQHQDCAQICSLTNTY